MMRITRVPFCIPIVFMPKERESLSLKKRAFNVIEKYFFLGQTQVFLIDPQAPLIRKPFKIQGHFETVSALSGISTVFKVLSYLTMVIPLIIFVFKCVFRYVYDFQEKKLIIPFSSEKHKFDKKDVKEEKSSPVPGELLVSTSSEDESELQRKVLVERSVEESFSSKDIDSEDDSLQDITKGLSVTLKDQPLVNEAVLSCDPNMLNSETIESLLKSLVDIVLEKVVDERINYLEDDNKLIVFELKAVPGVIFRTIHPAVVKLYDEKLWTFEHEVEMKKWCERLFKVQESLISNSLSHLYMPPMKQFAAYDKGKITYFLGTEKLPICSKQEARSLWKLQDRELQAAIKELTLLVEQQGLEEANFYDYLPMMSKDNKWQLAILPHNIKMRPVRLDAVPGGVKDLINNVHSEESLSIILSILPQMHKFFLQDAIEERREALKSHR